MLLTAYAGLSQRQDSVPGAAKSSLERAGERIVRLYESWNRPGKTAEWKAKLPAKDP